MANPVCEVLITEARLESPETGVDCSAGAIVDFWGVVRKLEDGREIDGIDYEAHTAMAEHQLRLVAEEATGVFQLVRILIQHRIGFVRAGEASLFLRITAEHRAAAFSGGQWVVDELKKRVPIWKRPRFKIGNPVTGVGNAGPRSVPAATTAP
jgi:molybdopterin synthase catalytic subunit